MNDGSTAVLTKIRSEDLRAAVAAGEPERASVIVEIDVPHPTVETVSPQTPDGGRRAKFRLTSPEPDPAETERRIAETLREVESILGRAPESYFSTSGSFVVEATGEQLRRIATLPFVTAIWPNSRRYK